jgi:hypothetical protein
MVTDEMVQAACRVLADDDLELVRWAWSDPTILGEELTAEKLREALEAALAERGPGAPG